MTKQKQIRINYDIDEVKELVKPMYLNSYEKTVEAFELEASVLPPDEDDPNNITFKKIFGISNYDEYYEKWLWPAILERVDIKYLVVMAHLASEDDKYIKQLAEASAGVYNKAIPIYQAFIENFDKELDKEHSETEVLEGEVLKKSDTFVA